MVTDEQLQQIMPNLPAAKRQLYLAHLNAALDLCGINTMLRTAAFLAQIAHESGEFRWMEELWGPTDAQKRYEPPSTLATSLGNTEPGDGARFKGRGPIQITGRSNYRRYGDLLSIDLIGQPQQAAAPEVAFRTAGLFWKTNGLNELADIEDFVKITRRINGGTNGLPDRQMYYARAKQVLADDFVAAPPTTRGSVRAAAPRLPDGLEPMGRGSEAIAELEAAAAPVAGTKKTAPRKAPAKKAAKTVVAKKAPAKKAATKKVAAKKAATARRRGA